MFSCKEYAPIALLDSNAGASSVAKLQQKAGADTVKQTNADVSKGVRRAGTLKPSENIL